MAQQFRKKDKLQVYFSPDMTFPVQRLTQLFLGSCLVSATAAQAQDIPLLSPPPPQTMMGPAPADIPPLVNVPPPIAQLPEPIRNLINAAIVSGDEAAVKAIMRFARQTNTTAAGQIDALEAEFQAKQAERLAREARERADRLANSAFLDNWKGEVELGGSISTGNTDNLAVYAGLALNREGLKWRHQLTGRIDFQQTNDETTAEHVNLLYQPGFKFNPELYVYGLTQYERDRFLGYLHRYTVGVGIGYALAVTPSLKINFQGGPAARRTDRIDEGVRSTAAGRGSINIKWAIRPSLSLSQDAAVYLESGDTNANATTSLDTRLLGALKARVSYNIQYERNAPTGREPIDTTTRASLIYSF